MQVTHLLCSKLTQKINFDQVKEDLRKLKKCNCNIWT